MPCETLPWKRSTSITSFWKQAWVNCIDLTGFAATPSSALSFQEHLGKYNQSQVEGLINGILSDVAVAADQLEEELDEHIFDQAVHNKLVSGAICLS